MACLDTSTFLDVMGRGTAEAERNALDCIDSLRRAQEFIFTTRLNVAELWVGVFRSRNPEEEQRKIGEALRDVGILDFDQLAAELFGEFKARLLSIGRPVGDLDVLIAAVARANGHALVTRNPADFQNMPGLTVISY